MLPEITKEQILSEIKRIADRDGRPPGRRTFERETGIRVSEWYATLFPRWGDAVRAAGYPPNEKNQKLPSEHVLRQYAEAVRHFGRIPTTAEIRIYGRTRTDFPSHTTFNNHFGNKAGLLAALEEWLTEETGFTDLIPLLPRPAKTPELRPAKQGYVYLLKSGSHYKIGRSAELERRVKEIRVTLPEEATLAHVIETDDPPGIEAYWHRRFAERRAAGEWFRLTSADVRAFKARKRQ